MDIPDTIDPITDPFHSPLTESPARTSWENLPAGKLDPLVFFDGQTA